MKGALALAVTVGVLLGSLLWATITDMFKDELRTRLGRFFRLADTHGFASDMRAE